MKVLHFVFSAVFHRRVPDADLNIIHNNIVLLYVVDRNTGNVVDTIQVNCPPGIVLFVCVRTLCLIPINSSSRNVRDFTLIGVV